MVVFIFMIILIILEFAYLLEIITTKYYRNRKESGEDETIDTSLTTVVIPVKDEKENIPSLIKSLVENVKSEVILVDDYSSDNSYNLMRELTSEHSNITVLKMVRLDRLNIHSLDYKLSEGVSFRVKVKLKESAKLAPRQTVLTFLYRHVKTEYVSIMDADIIVTKDWENRVVSKLEELKPKFLYGYTYIKPKTFIGAIESIELFFLFSVAFGMKRLSLPSSCMGNNMTFSLKDFNKIGGYISTGFAYNDDQATLNLFLKNFKRKEVIGDYDIKLESSEIGNFKDAVQQKIRWVNDGVSYDIFFIIPIIFLIIFSIALIFSPIYLKLIFAINFSIFIEVYSTIFDEKRVIRKSILLNLYIYIAPLFYLIKFIMFKRNKEQIIWKGNKI